MDKLNYFKLALGFLDSNYHETPEIGYSLVCWDGQLWREDDYGDNKGVYRRMRKSQEAHLKVLVCSYLQTDLTNCPTENITSGMVNNTILNIKGLVLEEEPEVITSFQGHLDLIKIVDASEKEQMIQEGAQYASYKPTPV